MKAWTDRKNITFVSVRYINDTLENADKTQHTHTHIHIQFSKKVNVYYYYC